MKTIMLSQFSSKSAVEALRNVPEREAVQLGENNVYWVGSVCGQDIDRCEAFVEHCRNGRLEQAKQFNDIAESSVYGILARQLHGEGYRLFVIQMSRNPSDPQRCLFTDDFDDFRIEPKPSVPKNIAADTSLSVRDILGNLFQ